MKKLVLSMALMFSGQYASALYTVQETGEILKKNELQPAVETQFITSGDNGVNLIGKLEKGFDDESNVRLTIGTGTTDFELGAFYKWVPFPDTGEQPAVGVTWGLVYAKYELDDVSSSSENELSLRGIPFASKKFEMTFGDLIPYVSIPIGLRNYNSDTDFTSQFVLGTRYKPADFEYCDFTAEAGLDIGEAFSYISFGAIFPAWILESEE